MCDKAQLPMCECEAALCQQAGGNSEHKQRVLVSGPLRLPPGRWRKGNMTEQWLQRDGRAGNRGAGLLGKKYIHI